MRLLLPPENHALESGFHLCNFARRESDKHTTFNVRFEHTSSWGRKPSFPSWHGSCGAATCASTASDQAVDHTASSLGRKISTVLENGSARITPNMLSWKSKETGVGTERWWTCTPHGTQYLCAIYAMLSLEQGRMHSTICTGTVKKRLALWSSSTQSWREEFAAPNLQKRANVHLKG